MNQTLTCWQVSSSLFNTEEQIFVGSAPLHSSKPDKITQIKLRLSCHLIRKLLPGSNMKEEDLELGQDSLGCPHFLYPDTLVSYSYCNKTLWSAVGKSAGLGVDAAAASEFEGDYPFHRVFHTEELRLVQQMCHKTTSGAAFLWACKEAVAKAMGTGFNTIDPYDIIITSCSPDKGGYSVEVTSDVQHRVAITFHQKQWIAVAV